MAHTLLHLSRTFDASHVLPGHPGKCGRLHGHTYRADVWLSGPVTAADGMLLDYGEIKTIIDAWDHRHLNDEVSFPPTAELLAAELQYRLLAALRGRLEEVAESRADARADGVAVEATGTPWAGVADPVEPASLAGCIVRLHETPGSYAQVGYLTVERPALDGEIRIEREFAPPVGIA